MARLLVLILLAVPLLGPDVAAGGLLVGELSITMTGCIREASVLKGASMQELHGVALQAVAKWKFEPATLDGRPVDVIDHFSIYFNR